VRFCYQGNDLVTLGSPCKSGGWDNEYSSECYSVDALVRRHIVFSRLASPALLFLIQPDDYNEHQQSDCHGNGSGNKQVK
jgi:hypothetical protein